MTISAISPPTILETKRLYLRELTPEKYKQLFEQLSEEDIKSYLGINDDAEYEEAVQRYEKGLTTNYYNFKGFHLLDKETNRNIGRCDYHTWVTSHKRAEIGYTITDEAYKNKGLMTEALAAVLAYGFERMELYRVEALVATYNVASLQLVSRFGFKREGLLRNHYMVDGVLEDSVMHSLLKPEFEEWQHLQAKA
ncbi:GNAT family protein [uncultured Pontibacter sp.]|uniref:GNAT family N-acetyltransferase n=1 Tax=uncultured Pontibacter sp. TaxID=453356 RepID=UPI00262C601B|nr:GNAT family protein [uncultured Pontibacter sp.]